MDSTNIKEQSRAGFLLSQQVIRWSLSLLATSNKIKKSSRSISKTNVMMNGKNIMLILLVLIHSSEVPPEFIIVIVK